MLIELETRAPKSEPARFVKKLIRTARTQDKDIYAICIFFTVLTIIALYVMLDLPHLDISGSF